MCQTVVKLNQIKDDRKAAKVVVKALKVVQEVKGVIDLTADNDDKAIELKNLKQAEQNLKRAKAVMPKGTTALEAISKPHSRQTIPPQEVAKQVQYMYTGGVKVNHV